MDVNRTIDDRKPKTTLSRLFEEKTKFLGKSDQIIDQINVVANERVNNFFRSVWENEICDQMWPDSWQNLHIRTAQIRFESSFWFCFAHKAMVWLCLLLLKNLVTIHFQSNSRVNILLYISCCFPQKNDTSVIKCWQNYHFWWTIPFRSGSDFERLC